VQKGRVIGQLTGRVELVVHTELLQTGLTRPLTDEASKHIVEEDLPEPLRLIHKVFLKHSRAADYIVVLFHRLTVLQLS
jgi:hypothetical protein